MCRRDKVLYWHKKLYYFREAGDNIGARIYRRFVKRQAHKADRAKTRLQLRHFCA